MAKLRGLDKNGQRHGGNTTGPQQRRRDFLEFRPLDSRLSTSPDAENVEG